MRPLRARDERFKHIQMFSYFMGIIGLWLKYGDTSNYYALFFSCCCVLVCLGHTCLGMVKSWNSFDRKFMKLQLISTYRSQLRWLHQIMLSFSAWLLGPLRITSSYRFFFNIL